MKIFLDQVPSGYRDCFNSEGHIIYENFIQNHLRKALDSHAYPKSMDAKTFNAIRHLLCCEVNKILPNHIECEPNDISISASIDNTQLDYGSVELAFYQPLLGILSSISIHPERIAIGTRERK